MYFVWGTTYIGIRVAVRTMPPLLMGGVRFVVAGAILYAIGVRTSGARHSERPTRTEWRAAAIAAVPMFLIAGGCVTWGETRVDAGNASLLVATVPFWLVLLDAAIARHRIAAPSAGSSSGSGRRPAGATLRRRITSTRWARRRSSRPHSRGRAARCTSAGRPRRPPGSWVRRCRCSSAGDAADRRRAVRRAPDVDLGAISAASLWGLIWLIGPGAIVGLSAYTFALKRLPTATVATYAYVNPLVAVGLGALLLNEPITTPMLTGGALVLASVAVIVGARRVARQRPAVT